MSKDEFTIDGGGILKALRSRTLIIEDQRGKQIAYLSLIWGLVIAVFLTPLVILMAIIGVAKQWRLRLVVEDDDQR
jgi:hypothetical protein